MRWRVRVLVLAPVLLFLFGVLMLSCKSSTSAPPAPLGPAAGFELESLTVCEGPAPSPTPTPSITPKMTPTATPCAAATTSFVAPSDEIGFDAHGFFVKGKKSMIADITDDKTTIWTSTDPSVLLPPLQGSGGVYLGQIDGCSCINASSGGLQSQPVGVAVGVPATPCPPCPSQNPPTATPAAKATSSVMNLASAPEASVSPAQSMGVLMWTYDAGSPISGRIAIGPDQQVYFISGDRMLHALDSSGKRVVTRPTGGTSVVVGSDGTVYAGSIGSSILALDSDGSMLWSADVGGAANPLAASGSTIYAAVGNELIAASAPGQVDWRVTLDSAPRSAGATADALVVATSNTVYGLASDGVVLWTVAPSRGFAGQISVSDSAAFFGSGSGATYAVELRTGAELWHVAGSHPVTSGPIAQSGGTIYVGARALLAISPDGHKAWTLDSLDPGAVPISPLADGGVFAIGTDGLAAAISPSGEYEWSSRSFTDVTTSASSAGTVFIGTSSGRVYAIK